MLTEWTGTNPTNTMDQTTINEGIGGSVFGLDGAGTSWGIVPVRQAYIQGIDNSGVTTPPGIGLTHGIGFGTVPNTVLGQGLTNIGTTPYCTRRYQVNFALGMFTQDKLVCPILF